MDALEGKEEVSREMTAAELLQDTPEDMTQTLESPTELSESVWGRLIPANSDHKDPALNQAYELRDDDITLGRGSANLITLPCANISSKHCRLIRQPSPLSDTIFLEDTSSNGTWVNKKKILKKRILLTDQCEIMLVPNSKKRKRPKLAYFLHLESKQKRARLRNVCQEGTFESKYHELRDIGKGAFSEVQLVQNRKTGDNFALKKINRHQWKRYQHATSRQVSLLDEVKIMQELDHPNIVKVHEYFETEKSVNVIMDYCVGGDMLEYVQDHGAYRSEKARRAFRQLVSAIDYLHNEKHVAHRDLKPDNILIQDKEGEIMKISDFGISRVVGSSKNCGTIIGTPLYQAPEVNRQNHVGYDGFSADYWSLGVILYVMLVAAPPINPAEQTNRDLMTMSQSRSLQWYDEPVPDEAKDLIYLLLAADPQKRIKAPEIWEHPWMKGDDDDDDDVNGEGKNENENENQNENQNQSAVTTPSNSEAVSTDNASPQSAVVLSHTNSKEEGLCKEKTQNGELSLSREQTQNAEEHSDIINEAMQNGPDPESPSKVLAKAVEKQLTGIGKKRKLDDDGDVLEMPPAKRHKSDSNDIIKNGSNGSSVHG